MNIVYHFGTRGVRRVVTASSYSLKAQS